MLIMKDVISLLKKSNKKVWIVLSTGRKIAVDEWEKNMISFGVIDCEVKGCTWTIEIDGDENV